MAHISDFTEDYIKSTFPNFINSQGIEIFDFEDFICLEFQIIVEKTANFLPTKNFFKPIFNFFIKPKLEQKSYKRYFYEIKFFDKVTGKFLGSSKDEAVKNLVNFGNDEFVKRNFKEALRLLETAFRNSEDGSKEAKIYRELVEITRTAIEAEKDLVEKLRHSL
ncbi:hypothetical protein PVAND_016677 [Polypedilum vanderplanki]|uniref:Uncharacterized protein n=1 Tax=Polypedilum vanderplanki TaxID=319348 RepID=A0A9J6BH10_POLVA|nr:hypothetical protein PVAND_016677 [Polypedilum vanderplanki]